MNGGNVNPTAKGLLDTSQIGAYHSPITLKREDQRHVDTDSPPNYLGDRGESSLRGGNLDENVFSTHPLVQLDCLLNGGLRVVSKLGRDFN